METTEQKIQKLYTEINRLRNIQATEIFGKVDYTGKYIYNPDYGYMYVTHRSTLEEDDRVLPELNGVAFSIISGGRYDLNISIDGNDCWTIYLPDDFVTNTKVITEEQFIQAYTNQMSEYNRSKGLLGVLEQVKRTL